MPRSTRAHYSFLEDLSAVNPNDWWKIAQFIYNVTREAWDARTQKINPRTIEEELELLKRQLQQEQIRESERLWNEFLETGKITVAAIEPDKRIYSIGKRDPYGRYGPAPGYGGASSTATVFQQWEVDP